MLLGLIADIHEAADLLREALEEFRRRGVEEVVFLGDLCAMHQRLEETVALLRGANASGVWGNHDFGLCHGVDAQTRRRYSAELFAYTGTLRPALVREDCLFTHVEPWLDANDVLQLWYFDGLPDTPRQARAQLRRRPPARSDQCPPPPLVPGHAGRPARVGRCLRRLAVAAAALLPRRRRLDQRLVRDLRHGHGELVLIRLTGPLPPRPGMD